MARSRLAGLLTAAGIVFVVRYLSTHTTRPPHYRATGSLDLHPQTGHGRCGRLMRGYPDHVNTTVSQPWHTTRVSRRVERGCGDLVQPHHRRRPVLEEETAFPLAFALIVHTAPDQVAQLMRTIYRPHNVYCIHVDRKASRSVSVPLAQWATCFHNVVVLQEVGVVYGGNGLVTSAVACMKMLANSTIEWKYYILLSGQEFVLKTNLEIVQILKILNGTNDVEQYPFPRDLRWRFETRYSVVNGTIKTRLNDTKPAFKRNITLYKGSMYGMFSRAFAIYILESDIAAELIDWAADSYAPEELVWATLNAQPGAPGGYDVTVKHDVTQNQVLSRAVIWEWDRARCQGKFVRSVCVFSHRDLPWLVSRPEVVANKFHSNLDQLVIDCLEGWLHRKAMLGETFNLNWYHYRNVPQSRLRSCK
ncbi:beta-1,3-galactosyl-O-glycosyl-glycoprotein beta-1,6-N-acetylglucosaminyltransferase-like [Haliotis rufescens]|uniref:beta-1,3-galactosyl-O-glycosyl-glycoprotein beta-1,6-N-acetylglucosaminyltransferase-like n=1 Tax=Haliotis rufescens TaxID=6454 RepID=UPI00201EB2C1|nr:beta-1,3-galactosyl-O-glycosyl-glycoprotein beta-1,6-N-acetylglucosaminyltransferase-like [Haliotis rufescens]